MNFGFVVIEDEISTIMKFGGHCIPIAMHNSITKNCSYFSIRVLSYMSFLISGKS